MVVSMIVAATTNHVIGKDNQLLWSLPKDMKFFKNTTWAMPVIMGSKTYVSLGKPLTGRLNIMITRKTDWNPEGVKVVHSLQDALSMAEAQDYQDAFIIGGGEIFAAGMQLADRIYFTKIDAILEGDTFFPPIDPAVFEMVAEENHAADEKHAYPFHFQRWEKKQS
ncbi:MAG: dihydrofolate reductase [Bacteroidota bacterium]|nr:dihydrofolate reductase [Bacteroidota bacterium]